MLKVGFIPIEGGHYYQDALEEVTRGEELGFDSVWMEEHHSVVNHYWPSPLPVLAGVATRTSRGTLRTDILVAAFYHPVRLAADLALPDVMFGRPRARETAPRAPPPTARVSSPARSSPSPTAGPPGSPRPSANGRSRGT